MTDAQKFELIKEILSDYYENGGTERECTGILLDVVWRILYLDPEKEEK